MKSVLAHPYAYVDVIRKNFEKERKNRSDGQKKRYGKRTAVRKPLFIRLIKKVVYHGLGGITFYPGTLMRVVSRSKNNAVVYATPITDNARSHVPARYIEHLESGFAFLKTGITFKFVNDIR